MELLNDQTWDDIFMGLCDIIAKKSKDKSTKVGAIIVGLDHEVRSMGFNGFPRGAIDSRDQCPIINSGPYEGDFNIEKLNERHERPLKYKWTEHAERNAIYNAARMGGASLKGCVIYINSLPPCCDCARAIIQSGISSVVLVENEVPERWQEECNIALDMLKECNIHVRYYKPNVLER